jgi:hypothetical protein
VESVVITTSLSGNISVASASVVTKILAGSISVADVPFVTAFAGDVGVAAPVRGAGPRAFRRRREV